MGTSHNPSKWRYQILLFLSIAIYTIIFSLRTYQKHMAFSSYAWDLGIFSQVFHSSVFGGKPFYYTPELYINPEGNYLAIHFSPILILLFPFYGLMPSVATLLTIKSLLLGLGAAPLFYVSKKITGDERTSLLVSLAYLLHPGLQGANWFDFQPQVFIPFLAFTTFLALLHMRWGLFVASLTLSLLIQEHVFAIMIALMGGYLAYCNLDEILESIKRARLDRHTISLFAMMVSAAWYPMARRFIDRFPIAPEFVEVYRAVNVYRALEYSGNTLALPLYAATHLDDLLRGLSYDLLMKFLYILLMLAPLLFLPLMNRLAVPTILLALPFLLSNYRAYYMIGSHYALYLIPVVFVSLLYTIRDWGEKTRQIGKQMVIVSALVIFFVSPLSPISEIINKDGWFLWYPAPARITERTRWLHDTIEGVPGDASILTQNHVFPHVSERTNAYVLPLTQYEEEQNRILEGYIEGLLNGTEYVLLDLKAVDPWTIHIHRTLSKDGGFGIAAFYDMIVLYQRGIAESGEGDSNETRTYYAHSDLHIDVGETRPDPTAENGYTVVSHEGSSKGFCLYGPYTYLLGYAYDVSLRVKASNHPEGYLATFEVTSDRGKNIVAKRDLYGYESPDDEWRTIDLKLGLERPLDLVEFRLYTVGAGDIAVDYVELGELDSQLGYHASTMTFNHVELASSSPLVTGEIIEYNTTGGDSVFWYGPYHTLPEGRYRATFYVKTDGEAPLDSPLLTLDACHEDGKRFLYSKKIYPDDLDAEELGWGWSRASFVFTIQTSEETIELRGIRPTGACNLSLGHILLEPIG